MCRFRILVCAFALLAAAACASSRQLADEAYLREDWDAAATNYAAALRDASESEEIAHIKPRLAETRTKAAARHLAKAQELVTIGDVPGAHAHAQRAFEFDPTPEAQALLGALRSREGARFLADGKAAADQGSWDRAIESLRKAQELAPSEDGRTLLSKAEEEAAKFHRAEFEKVFSESHERLKERNWPTAAARYADAHRHGSTAQSKREAEFARLMTEAEEHAASDALFAEGRARTSYGKAREFGIDVEYVETRLWRISLAHYSVTIHGAVILPFKPDSKKPWDGASGELAEADSLLKGLGRFMGPQGAISTELASAATKLLSMATDAPDCYVTVRVNGQAFGGAATKDQDDLEPVWNVGFSYDGITSADRRVVDIRVVDADGLENDNVGSVQMTLGDLVAVDGPRTIPFFSRDGVLQAGGILALRVSVQRN